MLTALLRTPNPYPTQVVNLVTKRIACVLGKVESEERFLRLALYQAPYPYCPPEPQTLTPRRW